MKYELFGRTGLRVSELCLGAMTFGEAWGWGASKSESQKIVDQFFERGGNFIDSANIYNNGESESFLGEILREKRQRAVLATKYTLTRDPQNPNAGGNHRKNMRESLEESLRRLQTDYIDVYWVHAYDPFTPLEEIMRSLDDAVREGKILYVGVSDFPAWEIARAQTMAELKDWTAFAGIQTQYNLIERTSERELIPMAEKLGLAVTAWSPLAGGALTGKYLQTAKDENRGARFDVADMSDLLKTKETRNVRIIERLVEISKELGKKPHHVALNWIRQRKTSTPMIPIIGAKNSQQLEDNLQILEFECEPEVIEELDRISSFDRGFPHEFLDSVKGMIYGETWDKIQKRSPY